MQERIDSLPDLEIRFINWWVMPGLQKNVIDKYFGEKEGYHATPTEVAVTMALIPDAIKLPETYTCPQQEVVGANATWVMPKKFRKLYPDGVMRADYSLATKEIGIEALRYSIKEIIEEFDFDLSSFCFKCLHLFFCFHKINYFLVLISVRMFSDLYFFILHFII